MANITLFSQIISKLDRSRFKKLVDEKQTDKHNKGYTSWTHLVSMLFCQFAKSQSVRDISNGLRSATGNSTSLQQYTYSDLTPSRLMRYYRLKQVDLNGQYEIYGPIASECIVDGMDFTIYPNPSSSSATIQLLNTKKETAEIKLLDISGKEFWSQELELVNGTTSMVLSTENLAPIYIIVLSSKDGILTNKLVVE